MTKQIFIFLFLVLPITTGCVITADADESMYELGAALTKLSNSVEAAARYKSGSAGLTDEALLQYATQHDPGLLAPFEGYRLGARIENRHAAVLVCTSDGRQALLEDAGCTARLDRHLWEHGAQACRFTLHLDQVCSRGR